MSRPPFRVVLVLAFFVLVYIAPLGLRPMVAPDEYRYADIPREMLASGVWVTPKLDGFLYFEKPVLGYWLNAVSIGLFGQSPFSVRLPAALSAGMSAFFVLWLVGRSDRGRDTPLLAAVVLLTALLFFGTGVFAVLDGPFTALITGTMACFFAAYTSTSTARRKPLLVLAGVLCGGAFMTKGFIAFAIPALSIIPFLVLERRLSEALKLVWIPCLSAVLISLPWAVAIRSRSPEFWPHFLWVEHVQRFLAPTSAQHPEPLWYFVPVFVIGALPWSALIPAALAGLRAAKHRDTLLTFAVCWFTATLVFFSLSSGKLSTYILPAFPPFAILMAAGLRVYLRSGRRLLWRSGALLMATLGTAAAALLFVNRLRLYDPANQWRPTILITTLLISSCFALAAAKVGSGPMALKLFAASPLLPLFCLHFVIPAAPIASDTPGAFLKRYARLAGPGTAVVSDIGTIHAACWTFKRNDIMVLDNPGELRFGVQHSGTAVRSLTQENISAILAKSGVERVLFATETTTMDRYRHLLPRPVFEESEAGLVVAEVILAHSNQMRTEGFAADPDTNGM